MLKYNKAPAVNSFYFFYFFLQIMNITQTEPKTFHITNDWRISAIYMKSQPNYYYLEKKKKIGGTALTK